MIPDNRFLSALKIQTYDADAFQAQVKVKANKAEPSRPNFQPAQIEAFYDAEEGIVFLSKEDYDRLVWTNRELAHSLEQTKRQKRDYRGGFWMLAVGIVVVSLLGMMR